MSPPLPNHLSHLNPLRETKNCKAVMRNLITIKSGSLLLCLVMVLLSTAALAQAPLELASIASTSNGRVIFDREMTLTRTIQRDTI